MYVRVAEKFLTFLMLGLIVKGSAGRGNVFFAKCRIFNEKARSS